MNESRNGSINKGISQMACGKSAKIDSETQSLKRFMPISKVLDRAIHEQSLLEAAKDLRRGRRK